MFCGLEEEQQTKKQILVNFDEKTSGSSGEDEDQARNHDFAKSEGLNQMSNRY